MRSVILLSCYPVILLSCYPVFVVLRVILSRPPRVTCPAIATHSASLHANESIHWTLSSSGDELWLCLQSPVIPLFFLPNRSHRLSLFLRVIREWPQGIPNSPSSSACRSPEGTLWILLLQVPFASLTCSRESDVLTGPSRLSGMRPRIRLCGMFCPGRREVMT